MKSLSRKIKNDLFSTILNQKNPFGELLKDEGILDFLIRIWDLQTMPSYDSRFNDAYGDIYQHMINNNDWDFEYLFIERLNILDNDEVFIKFIQTIIHPDFRNNNDEITKFYLLINPYLEKENQTLVIVDDDSNGLPIYEIKSKNDVSSVPIGIKENSIPFFIDFKPNGRFDRENSHSRPSEFPSFILVLNKDWNDYSLLNEFNLYYYNSTKECFNIGLMKIIHNDSGNLEEVLPKKFTFLDGDYCSLGQKFIYYSTLKEIIGKDFESVLWALKDVAFFPEIHEKNEKNWYFKNSLIRYDEPERLLREAKYKIYDYDLSNLYSFKYSFKPKYSNQELEIQFNFNNNDFLSNRIYAIIGKNGTGKTQLMTSLPIDIYKKKDDKFLPKTPLFSKVIAVSYSAFDTFETPMKTGSFNYLYCGLKDLNGEWISDRGLILRFHNTWKKIKSLERMEKWIKILQNFIDEDIINEFIIREDNMDFTVSLEGFAKSRKMLSSGQSIILYIISEIVANIRFDSIILYDEPETHLHPNAISQLINTLYELVNEFQSYCIIATHSPLIIREIMSKNVFVIEREGNYPSIRKIGIESFGENLTVLTDEVFGNRGIPKQYKLILERMVNNGFNFDQIINKLETDNVPLSLNARIYLKSLTDE